MGSYVKHVRSEDPDNPGFYLPPETSDGEWGGELSSCIAGTALETQELDSQGFPMDKIHFVEATGFTEDYKIPSLEEMGRGSSVYTANYYHSGDTGYIHGSRTVIPPVHPALKTPSKLFSGGGRAPQLFYEWQCLDRTHEVLARIRVQVQEWDEENEWESGSDADTGTNTVTAVISTATAGTNNIQFASGGGAISFLYGFPTMMESAFYNVSLNQLSDNLVAGINTVGSATSLEVDSVDCHDFPPNGGTLFIDGGYYTYDDYSNQTCTFTGIDPVLNVNHPVSGNQVTNTDTVYFDGGPDGQIRIGTTDYTYNAYNSTTG
jgi:hypothetical protein